MINRGFGNFTGSVDAVAETVLIVGSKSGWRQKTSVDEISGQIKFYRKMERQALKKFGPDKGRKLSSGYVQIAECFEWAERILSDE